MVEQIFRVDKRECDGWGDYNPRQPSSISSSEAVRNKEELKEKKNTEVKNFDGLNR